VRSLSLLVGVRGPDHFFSYSRPKCKPFAERVGGMLDRLTKALNYALRFGGSSGSTDSKDGSAHPRWRECFSTFVNGGAASGQRLRDGFKTVADAAGLFGLHRSNITRLLARATE
jgi:hypothetical protein